MNVTSEEVGEQIRILRTLRGVSQEEFAHEAGLHRTYVGAIERAEKCPTVETLVKITNALGISLSDFFRRIEEGHE